MEKIGPKLTQRQDAYLAMAAKTRPVAGNDDGWLSLCGFPRQSLRALSRQGLIESRWEGPCTTSSQLHRITEAGRTYLKAKNIYKPDDPVVVRNCDADEAGDYRIFRHSDVVDDPNWEIMHDIKPEDLD